MTGAAGEKDAIRERPPHCGIALTISRSQRLIHRSNSSGRIACRESHRVYFIPSDKHMRHETQGDEGRSGCRGFHDKRDMVAVGIVAMFRPARETLFLNRRTWIYAERTT